MMPTIFCLIIIFCIWLTYERRKVIKLEERERESLLQRERKANFAIRKDISKLDYIEIPMTSLPIHKGSDDGINAFIDSLYKINETPILNLSGLSNTELKLQYGASNFERLSEYDENYYSLIRLLANWGCSLYEMNEPEKAKQVLEYAVSIGSDIKVTFYTLAKLYVDEGNDEKFQALKSNVQMEDPDHSEPILLELEKIRCHQYFE